MANTKTSDFHLVQSPTHLLHRALQLALDLYAEEFKALKLTHRQLAVLTAAAEYQGLSQTDLVATTGIDRSTLAEMVARMIDKGMLERKRSPRDARANIVTITEDGRKILDEALPRIMAVDKKIMKILPKKGLREKFLLALQHLAHVVEEAEGIETLEDGKKKKKKKKKRDKEAKARAAKDEKKKTEKKKTKKEKKALKEAKALKEQMKTIEKKIEILDLKVPDSKKGGDKTPTTKKAS